MGTETMKPRCVRYTIRLTEEEDVDLHLKMENLDYLSVAKYFRDKGLDKQIQVNKNIVLTDRNLRNQINNLTATIAKIGVAYNQATKKFHTLSKKTHPDGTPMLNVRSANFYLISLQKMTRALNKNMDTIIEIVSRLDYDNIPHGGEYYNPQNSNNMLQKIEVIGNLVSDAEVKTGKEGKEFVSFRIAVNEGSGDDKKSTFYEISYVKSGLLQYLKKGQAVYVSGKLSLNAVCKDDKAYLNAYISAKDIVLLGGRDN